MQGHRDARNAWLGSASVEKLCSHPSICMLLHAIFTARKRSLRRLCFYTCLSVILFTWGVCLSACWDSSPHPQEQTPLGADTPRSRHPGADTPSPGADTPRSKHPRSRHLPEQCMLGDMANIWLYASYWNAYLSLICYKFVTAHYLNDHNVLFKKVMAKLNTIHLIFFLSII